MSQKPRSRRATFAGIGIAATIAVLSTLSGNAVAGADEGAIRGADSKNAIEGSYIVVFKDNVAARSAGEKISRLVSRVGGTVKHTYRSALRGYSAKMSEAQAKRVAADPAVAYVEQDQIMRTSADQLNPPSWGLDRVDQRDLPLDAKYSYSTTASNVNAYIIDTGILTTHNDFGGRAKHGRDTVDGDNDANDCNGHGTHVAGTVGGTAHGVAKGVTLYAVRVLNCQGSGSNSGVIAGVDWVTANAVKPAVANMSLGGGASSALDDSVRRSISSGITYAVASGNGNFLGMPQNACNYSPARVTEALTVNSSTRSDAASSFSNYGSCTDLYAPGSDITSAWIGSNTATRTISGTSMAAPHVAGAAALYLAGNTSASASQVHAAIVDNASTGKLSGVRSGTPNKLLYTGSGDTTPPPEPGTCSTQTNDTNVSIPDAGSAVTSSITISGCDRNASSTAKVAVDIKHTYRGDLAIDLITSTGAVINLKGSNAFDSADNVVTTYTVNASAYPADGTWKLRVRDVYRADTGYIDSWSFTP
ncbi:MAG: S8 family peptidase [Haloechinothrix sp.]